MYYIHSFRGKLYQKLHKKVNIYKKYYYIYYYFYYYYERKLVTLF